MEPLSNDTSADLEPTSTDINEDNQDELRVLRPAFFLAGPRTRAFDLDLFFFCEGQTGKRRGGSNNSSSGSNNSSGGSNNSSNSGNNKAGSRQQGKDAGEGEGGREREVSPWPST